MGKVLDKTEQKNASFVEICKIPEFFGKSPLSKAKNTLIYN
jgi:hypothetical protein